jgi:NSS family neurotransmitter:Na+ symporter
LENFFYILTLFTNLCSLKYNLEPGQGVGLAFNTLPIAFGQMPFGVLFGTLFFILLTLAAWSSAISLIEPAVAWLVETKKFTRWMAAITDGLVAWLVGLLTVFSFNIWQDVKPLAGKTWFELIDFTTQNVMLPLGGLFIAIFAAWLMKNHFITEELAVSCDSLTYRIWRFLVRYVTPVGIGLVFLNAIGVLS